MPASVRLIDEALREVQGAFEWYESRQQGLGERFLRALERCLNRIAEWPEMYERLYRRYRRAKVHRFPFVVIYEIWHSEIIVHAVFNTWRNPKVLRRRLK